MDASLQILTTSGVLPLSLAEAKLHLRVDHTDDDGPIAAYLQAAVDMIERRTGRCFRPITATLHLSEFPNDGDPIVIPRPPLISVTAISYTDTSGGSITLSSGLYTAIPSAAPGLIVPAINSVWPVAMDRRSSVLVTFAAGDVTKCPPSILDAIRLYIDHAYHEHEPLKSSRIQDRIEALIAGHVLRDRNLIGIST